MAHRLPEDFWAVTGALGGRLLQQQQTEVGPDGLPIIVDICSNPCGSETCAYFNRAFACWELDALYCNCRGCCNPGRAPLFAGGVMAIVVSCVWLLSFSCYAFYRKLAFRELENSLDGQKAPSRNSEEDLDLTDEQIHSLRRKRRYELSILNLLFPCISFCCPMLHRYFVENLDLYCSDVTNALRSCLGCAKRAARGAKYAVTNTGEAVKQAGALTRQATMTVVTAIEGGTAMNVEKAVKVAGKAGEKVENAAQYVGKSLAEYNVTGVSIHSTLQQQHGQNTTSYQAKGVAFNKAPPQVFELPPKLTKTTQSLPEGIGRKGGLGAPGAPPKLAHTRSAPALKRAPGSLPNIRQGALATIDDDEADPYAAAGLLTKGKGGTRGERVTLLQKRRYVSSCATALVAVATGGVAEISGDPEEIDSAASQIERAAADARLRCARARGVRYAPLPPPEGLTAEERSLAAALAAEAAAGGGGGGSDSGGAGSSASGAAPTSVRAAQAEADLAAVRRTLEAKTNEVARLKKEVAEAKAAGEEQARAWAAEATKAKKVAADAAKQLEEELARQTATVGKAKTAKEAAAAAERLAADVTRGVAAEPDTHLATARKSFAGRRASVGGGGGGRRSFMAMYERASRAVPGGGDDDDEPWADDDDSPNDRTRRRRSTLSGLAALREDAADDGAGGAGGPAGGPDPAVRQERLERLRKLEEMQAAAEEAERLAMEEAEAHELEMLELEQQQELEQLEQQQQQEQQEQQEQQQQQQQPAAAAGGSMLRRLSTSGSRLFGGRKDAKGGDDEAAMDATSAAPTESAQPAESAEPPAWVALLEQYTQQLAQIEEWLQVEPTEEEIEDGSAIEKAMTLIAARDELTGKIQQLEAVRDAHGQAAGR